MAKNGLKTQKWVLDAKPDFECAKSVLGFEDFQCAAQRSALRERVYRNAINTYYVYYVYKLNTYYVQVPFFQYTQCALNGGYGVLQMQCAAQYYVLDTIHTMRIKIGGYGG